MLSTKERSYLQTFPKDFVFEGNKTDLEQMIGNAVPVNLAYFVASAIKSYVEQGCKSSCHLPSFEVPNARLNQLLKDRQIRLAPSLFSFC